MANKYSLEVGDKVFYKEGDEKVTEPKKYGYYQGIYKHFMLLCDDNNSFFQVPVANALYFKKEETSSKSKGEKPVKESKTTAKKPIEEGAKE